MEASTLTHVSRGGLLGRRSPLLKLQGDERLVASIRAGNEHAFEALFERYHSRLLAFCRHMLRSTEDAEDVLQEVFVKAHAAMLADQRPINVRPWLYRIARNRCLNHLRKPVPDGQDSMDLMVGENGVSTADRVQKREDFRCLVADVRDLPETQRTALLLRELDALCYEEIAQTMDTTVPAVKSLLVRARMSLAEATHSRQLTCGEVRLELAEAAEGLGKATGPARHHIKRCEPCRAYRTELRSNTKALAALAPLGPLALLHQFIVAKLGGFGGSGTAAGGSAAGSGAVATAGAGAGAAGTGAAAAGAGAVAAGGGGALAGAGAAMGGIGGAIGVKAAATAATAALLTAGAVEVRQIYSDKPADAGQSAAAVSAPPKRADDGLAAAQPTIQVAATAATPAPNKPEPAPAPSQVTATEPVAPEQPAVEHAQAQTPAIASLLEHAVAGPPAGDGDGAAADASASGASAGTAQPATSPPAASSPPASSTPSESSPAPAQSQPAEGGQQAGSGSAEPEPNETSPSPSPDPSPAAAAVAE